MRAGKNSWLGIAIDGGVVAPASGSSGWAACGCEVQWDRSYREREVPGVWGLQQYVLARRGASAANGSLPRAGAPL